MYFRVPDASVASESHQQEVKNVWVCVCFAPDNSELRLAHFVWQHWLLNAGIQSSSATNACSTTEDELFPGPRVWGEARLESRPHWVGMLATAARYLKAMRPGYLLDTAYGYGTCHIMLGRSWVGWLAGC